jgi:hypothetical protein
VTVRLRPNDERRFVKSSIPPGWAGETVVLIACGPSVKKAQIQTVKHAFYSGDCKVMVVNRACEKWGLWWTPGPDGDAAAGHSAIGISEDPSYIHFGCHSGFQALNVAVHLGAKRILLVGYDCHHNGGRHFHSDHPAGWMNAEAPNMWLPPYRQAAPQLKARGVEVINCSPGSAIESFPMSSVGAVL